MFLWLFVWLSEDEKDSLAWLGWVLVQVGQARQGWIRTELRPVLKPERQAGDERLVRDVDHVAVVEKASFE
ncbi:hypothetical protein PPACK8108_LOCUS7639 [Phakopsora pachyrhizi]|uniref:Secreted protein n=1 Tax=Phakopsora pachyrhizi TaxID=170000 RepID=A0AAV0AVG9_PHAPC|nr:hypothetical protein PPACK8108_LOCUS7639 [Phakopsora pachyrhizi]